MHANANIAVSPLEMPTLTINEKNSFSTLESFHLSFLKVTFGHPSFLHAPPSHAGVLGFARSHGSKPAELETHKHPFVFSSHLFVSSSGNQIASVMFTWQISGFEPFLCFR